MKTFLLPTLAIGFLFSSLSLLNAATVTWDGGGDGTSWGSAQAAANLNWSGDTVPVLDDDVTINPSTNTSIN